MTRGFEGNLDKASKDGVGDELVQVCHTRLSAEFELHLAQAREPQLKLGVQVERACGLDREGLILAMGSEMKSFFLPVMP